MQKGILYFLNQSYTQKLSEVFKVKVGAVSGCDKIFKNEKYGNLEFVTSITKRTNALEKMVFVNEPNDYLLQHKDSLMQRKIKNSMKITGLSGGECITYPLKTHLCQRQNAPKKPLFYPPMP